MLAEARFPEVNIKRLPSAPIEVGHACRSAAASAAASTRRGWGRSAPSWWAVMPSAAG